MNAYEIGTVWIRDRVSQFNVLHLPDLNINLLSVNKILQHSYDVLFSRNGYMIRQGNKDVPEAVRVENLFRNNTMSHIRPMLYAGTLSHSISALPGSWPMPAKGPSLLLELRH